jgi:hypothetical protein
MGFLLLSFLLLMDVSGATLDLMCIRGDIYAIVMCHNQTGRLSFHVCPSFYAPVSSWTRVGNRLNDQCGLLLSPR